MWVLIAVFRISNYALSGLIRSRVIWNNLPKKTIRGQLNQFQNNTVSEINFVITRGVIERDERIFRTPCIDNLDNNNNKDTTEISDAMPPAPKNGSNPFTIEFLPCYWCWWCCCYCCYLVESWTNPGFDGRIKYGTGRYVVEDPANKLEHHFVYSMRLYVSRRHCNSDASLRIILEWDFNE